MSRLIDGIAVKRLKPHADERGRLTEVVRADDAIALPFAQLNLITAWPGVIKGWRRHREQAGLFTVASGFVKLVVHDDREESETSGETNEFFIGDHNPVLVRVPAGVLYGFKGIGDREAVVVHLPDRPWKAADPDEDRVDPHVGHVPYDWDRQDG
jgi:dTDP-4-dehydrorhamnose 3,5-epimerase